MNKKNTNKTILALSLVLLPSFLLSACGPDSAPDLEDVTTIQILHQEDYMDEDLIKDFEKEYAPHVKVIFNKSETNETLYNEIQTGKATYNLVTCSEYMIQRLASEDLIRKINMPKDSVYHQNISHWMSNDEGTGMIDQIRVKSYDETHQDLGSLAEYTAGYMWGTLGSVINPYYSEYQARDLSKDYLIDLLRGYDGWSAFWNPVLKGTHSIKESMRDTYALGIFEHFKTEFLSDEYTYKQKNDDFFNNHEPETIKAVKDILIDLKSNIFGFEVDSGKNDIVTGKIGMNLAWSGDAAFSILQGEYYPENDFENEKPEEKKTKLYYNIPKSASNVWFDGFAMPKTTLPDSKEYEWTIKFIDFISRPENVVRNMISTGFTSFMAGDGLDNDIVSYVKDTFDSEDRTGLVPYNISYFFNNVSEEDMTLYVDPDSFEGRTIVAQYPSVDDIDHLYIMEDYGEDNGKIVQMWEDIKVNPLPNWVVILLVIFVLSTVLYLGSYKLIKAYKVRKRKALRNKN